MTMCATWRSIVKKPCVHTINTVYLVLPGPCCLDLSICSYSAAAAAAL